jgi:hypothetical protein
VLGLQGLASQFGEPECLLQRYKETRNFKAIRANGLLFQQLFDRRTQRLKVVRVKLNHGAGCDR